MIAIVDYGMGNLRSVEKAFEKVGAEAAVAVDSREVAAADAVVLPGVGAFGDAMEHLRSRSLDKAVLDAIATGKPFLGVCLGLQLLFEYSLEDGRHEGLAVFEGTVERLQGDVKIPHMGWNQLKVHKESPILAEVPEGCNYYFVHSYVVKPVDQAVVLTTTDYGIPFVSGVAKDNVHAFQFHPEKSGDCGLEILRDFAKLA